MVNLDLIQKLRERTGLGMMDCKKALLETNGDIEKAIEILRKKGSLIAEKRGANKTSQGIIHSYIHAGARIGVLLELNCETDFVAKTDVIKSLAHDICMHIAANNPRYLSEEFVDKEVLEKEMEIAKELLLKEKKPESVMSSILEGKKKKFCAESCLLTQSFIRNDKISVDQHIKETIAKTGENIKVARFARFEIGC
jgi:elongation factor Ts